MGFKLSVNARPDSNGRVWYAVADGHGESRTAFSAQCLYKALRLDVADFAGSNGVIFGVKSDDADALTAIIRGVAEYYCGNPTAAIFQRAESGTEDNAGPTLHFLLPTGVR